WFTDVEDKDPASMATVNERNNAMNYCQSKTSPPVPYYRWQRPTNGNCTEIQWITGDVVDGPLHSNDSLLICGAPQFGGSGTDKIEVVPTVKPRVAADSCTDSSNVKGLWRPGADKLIPPADDQPLKTIAQNGGALYSGGTVIRLNLDRTSTVAPPGNGVIFVHTKTVGKCDTVYPPNVNYSENDSGCGNVYVSGTYSA